MIGSQDLNRFMEIIVTTKIGNREKRMNRNIRLILRIWANPLLLIFIGPPLMM